MARILRIPEICRRTGECRSTLYNRIRDGLWPKLIEIGPRLRGQPDYEVDQMIQARIAGRTTEETQALVLRVLGARKTADQGEEKRPAVSSTTEAAEKFGPQFGSPRGSRRKREQARDDAKQKVRASPRPKSARRNGSGRKPAPDEIGRTT
jgi:prophage regulatory protein